MADIATRVHDHNWRIDPIVRSMLDTDFYKLLMLQTVFRRHADVMVEFSLINRSKNVPLARMFRKAYALLNKSSKSSMKN